jgi:hypothetical protein
VQLSDGAARNLARDPRVALVEEDGVVTAAALQSDPAVLGSRSHRSAEAAA